MNRFATTAIALTLAAPLALGSCSSQTEGAGSDAQAESPTTEASQDVEQEPTSETQAGPEDTTQDKRAGTTDSETEDTTEAEAGPKSTATSQEAEAGPKSAAAQQPDPDKEYDNLASWNIKVVVPEGTEGVLDGSDYYLYTQNTGEIPYVMVHAYSMDTTAEQFLEDFADYMEGQYDDLTVAEGPSEVAVGNKDAWKVVYSYSIQGYDARDTRYAIVENDTVYLFGSKEVEALDRTVGGLLEEVVSDSIIYGSAD